ncbi:MAG: succinate dehydrogenase iron-sulfur subunit [Candidatus Koribacter versatilis]|uniref:succinate dehydrogenase n=1 Tax=Candidatus Korobacter versatilis TaxID=658062 RepID=A0A932A7K7_9BACT|nr:succinate dehydrogenase iron-sulfur subunit [Candidatus Koribacter versatilis]
MADKTIQLKIKRQPNPEVAAYWEDFELPWRPNMNVISVLMELAMLAKTKDGKPTTPITYDSNCLEEVCGSCAMLINGKAHMACSALIDDLEQPIKLEPLSKFPIVRDLAVDRKVLFENLKRVKAWIPIDGTYDLGPGPRQSEAQQNEEYPYSRCISCTCCMEVCPQFNEDTGFVGAATIAQVLLFNLNPTGQMQAPERLRALMGDGGIHECGYAQNCVEICPKDIPLTKAIATVGRAVVGQAVKDLFTT